MTSFCYKFKFKLENKSEASEFSEASLFWVTLKVSGPVNADSGMIVNLMDLQKIEKSLQSYQFSQDSLAGKFKEIYQYSSGSLKNLKLIMSFENIQGSVRVSFSGTSFEAYVEKNVVVGLQKTAFAGVIQADQVADVFKKPESLKLKITHIQNLENEIIFSYES